MRLFFFALVLLSGCISCGPAGKGVLGHKNLHEQYGEKLRNANLQETTLGKLWFAEAEKALAQPHPISLPYRETGFLQGEKPRAIGLSFAAQKGAKLLFRLERNPANDFAIFADLWLLDETGKPAYLQSVDTGTVHFDYETEVTGRYILRLQPELLKSADYTLSISVGPSLGSPVAGNKGKIGSFWGDDRDAGRRRHEGLDIFAPFRTPVVAVADGTVTRVEENNLGGKVVWLKPKGKNITLYYAHLDEQLVSAGQTVVAGDTVGLIGTTGNAKHSSPHLHFGIYTFGGAIDPLPFIDQRIRNPKNAPVSALLFKKIHRLNRTERAGSDQDAGSLKVHTIIYPVAVSSSGIRAELADGNLVQLPVASVQPAVHPLRSGNTKRDVFLFNDPGPASSRKLSIPSSSPVKVLGYFNDFAFVRFQEEEGWVPLSFLNGYSL